MPFANKSPYPPGLFQGVKKPRSSFPRDIPHGEETLQMRLTHECNALARANDFHAGQPELGNPAVNGGSAYPQALGCLGGFQIALAAENDSTLVAVRSILFCLHLGSYVSN